MSEKERKWVYPVIRTSQTWFGCSGILWYKWQKQVSTRIKKGTEKDCNVGPKFELIWFLFCKEQ